MKHELWYSVVVRDRHGKVVSRERRRSKSFLKQWSQLVYCHVSRTAQTITDTGGVGRVSGASYKNFDMSTGVGDTTHGIRVGTGNTPVAIDDYALETPIEEGAGAGQMNHLACYAADPVVAAPSCSILVPRSIVNNSPAEITVREAAIYMRLGITYYGCATRDVFGAPQAVPVAGTITVNWTIQVTV